MENFFEKYPNAGAGELPRSQSIEQVKNNIEWLKVNKEEIRTWLEAQPGPWSLTLLKIPGTHSRHSEPQRYLATWISYLGILEDQGLIFFSTNIQETTARAMFV